MERVAQLLTFGKEFLADKNFENLNENIIWSLKETVDKALVELRCEKEVFWDSFHIPQGLKARYLALHKECKAVLGRLTSSVNRGVGKMRQKHLFSISDDEEDSFENPRICFEHLQTLFLDLEIEYNHYQKTAGDSLAGEPAEGGEEQVKLPVVLFSDFSDCFSKLNRIFRFQAQTQHPGKGAGPEPLELTQARELILECQKERLLVHVWALLRDSNKIAKILQRMLQGCRVLYGHKLMSEQEPFQRRKESSSEKMSSLLIRPVSSMKLSMNLSKIRPKYSNRFNDSFANEVNDLFCSDDLSMHARGGGDLRFVGNRAPPPPPVREYPGPRLAPKRFQEDDAFGRCYCSIF